MMNALAGARRAFLLGCLLGAGVPLAQADVTTQQRISIDGIGGMQIANLAGTTTTIISADRSRTETDLQMQSKMLRMLAQRAAGPSVEIVRLDLGKIDHLNMAKKEYTETTFAAMREQMQRVAASANGPAAQPNLTPIDDSRCTWSDSKAEVKRTGETTNIAGYDAERLTLKASQACTDKQTGQVCEFVLTLDQWLAPKFQSSGEALKYHRAFAEQLGLGTTATTSRDIAERAQAMFGRYKGIWSELAAKSAEMKGYPMKTTFSFAVGGPQCQTAQNGQASNPPPPSSNDASANQNASSPPPPTNATDAAAQISNKLAGFFKKNSASAPADAGAQNGGGTAANAPPATAAAPPPDSLVPLITMSSEIVSVSTAPVDPSLFEIPVGFTRVTR
jgi:hypothetical protein